MTKPKTKTSQKQIVRELSELFKQIWLVDNLPKPIESRAMIPCRVFVKKTKRKQVDCSIFQCSIMHDSVTCLCSIFMHVFDFADI